MARSIRALALLAAVTTACADNDPANTQEEIRAGEAARAFDIESYRIDQTADAISIGLLDTDGGELATISIVDDLASRPIASDDDGEHVPRTIRFRTDDADAEVLRISSPVVYLAEAGTSIWHAALIDPALAPAMGERGLEFRAGTPPGWSPSEVGYSGEYPCGYGYAGEGHPVNPDNNHAPGWNYRGCNVPIPDWPSVDQIVSWAGPLSGCNRLVHGIDRACDANCCGFDASKGRPDCQTGSPPSPCSGYGVGGCIATEHWDTAYCEYYSPNCWAPECQNYAQVAVYVDNNYYYVGQYASWEIFFWSGYWDDSHPAYWWTWKDGSPQAQGAYAGTTPAYLNNYAFQAWDVGNWTVMAQVVDSQGYNYWTDPVYVTVSW